MWTKALKIMAGIFLVLLMLCVVLKDSIIRWEFERYRSAFKKNNHVILNVSSISSAGLNGLTLFNLVLMPEKGDTFLHVNKVYIRVSVAGFITGKLAFNYISADTVLVNIYNLPERNNIAWLNSSESRGVKNGAGSYRERIAAYKQKLDRVLHTVFEIKEVRVCYNDSAIAEKIYLPRIDYDRNNLSGIIINDLVKDTLLITGSVRSDKEYTFQLIHPGAELHYLPFFDVERKLNCSFKCIKGVLRCDNTRNDFLIAPDIQVQDLHVKHWRLASDEVVVHSLGVKGKYHIGEKYVEVDSSSRLYVNSVSCKVFLHYRHRPTPLIALQLSMPETPSDTFFNSLPKGMFNTLKGISCTGTLAYDLALNIDSREPDSLKFSSLLRRNNLRIAHYGIENYERINGPFMYDAYSGDQVIRRIMVGPENPDYTPLNKISPYLSKCVMQSEDPGFMQHRGFITESFRESIAKNYKEHRFARGGSTISMQLVKNVFLNRNKTIARKAEEALIVYLIENLGLVGKERMLEVYLNVIEWGPGVYGIGEASRFYFNKRPSELNLPECVFLAAIVPNPKSFRYQFDKEGNNKAYLNDFFKIITQRMASKGWINENEAGETMPALKLKGPAIRMILPADSLPAVNDEMFPALD